MPRPKKDVQQCSVCNCTPTKTSLFVCESGHVTCKNCQITGITSETRHDSGDYVPQQGPSSNTCKFRKNISTSAQCFQNLESGDHDKRKTLKPKRKTRSECKASSLYENNKVLKNHRRLSEERSAIKEELQTIIEYKNDNYQDNKSSTSSLGSVGSNESDERSEKHNDSSSNKYKTFTRPVTCPVSECRKMVAMDSIKQHFHFDHSRVPRLALKYDASKPIALKLSNLKMETQCLAVLNLKEQKMEKESKETKVKVDSAEATHNSSNPSSLLLLGVKMPNEYVMIQDHRRSITILREAYAQTDVSDVLCYKKHRKITRSARNENLKQRPGNEFFSDGEVLLMWMCKLDEKDYNYSITLLRKDKKLGHSYIGEALHVRDSQDATNIHQSAECLAVRGIAVNKLFDDQNQILALVSLLE